MKGGRWKINNNSPLYGLKYKANTHGGSISVQNVFILTQNSNLPFSNLQLKQNQTNIRILKIRKNRDKKKSKNPFEGNIFIPGFHHNTIAHYYDRKNSLCPLGTDSTHSPLTPHIGYLRQCGFSFLYHTHTFYTGFRLSASLYPFPLFEFFDNFTLALQTFTLRTLFT